MPSFANDVVVRSMEYSDLADVLRIQSVCYTELVPESESSFVAKLRASPATCFVASRGGEVVGYLFSIPWHFSTPPRLDMQVCELPESPDCLYLHDLAIAPVARGSGVGQALVAAFLETFERLKVERASLIAVQGSMPYWRQYGFQAVEACDSIRAKLASYGSDVEYMTLLK